MLWTAGCSSPAQKAHQFVVSGDRYAAGGRLKEAIIQYRSALQYQSGDAATYAKLGRVYEQLEDHDNAFASFVRAAQLDESDVDAQVRVASGLIEAGRFADAETFASRAVLHHPHDARALAALGAALSGLGRREEAATRLRASADIAPHLAFREWISGIELLQTGAAAGARAAFERAVAIDSRHTRAWTALGQACWRLRDDAAAATAFEHAFALAPHSDDLQRTLAAFYARTGDTARAEAHLRSLADEHPQDRLALADFYIAAGRADDAARELARLKDPALAKVARLRWAAVYEKQGRRADADRELSAAVADKATAAEAHVARSRVLLGRGDAAHAAEDAEAALRLRPEWTDATYALGLAKLAQGDVGEAERRLNAARSAGGDPVLLDLALARVAMAARRDDEAITLAKRARAAAPTTASALVLAEAFRRARRLDDAERVLVEARDGDPASVALMEALAQVSLMRGKLPQAVKALQDLTARRPGSAGDFVALGMLQQESGDAAGAAQAYERALAIDQHAAIAANNLAWIYAERGRVAEALELAARAQKLAPSAPQMLHTLGWMNHLAGNNTVAFDLLTRARDADARNARYRRDLDVVARLTRR